MLAQIWRDFDKFEGGVVPIYSPINWASKPQVDY